VFDVAPRAVTRPPQTLVNCLHCVVIPYFLNPPDRPSDLVRRPGRRIAGRGRSTCRGHRGRSARKAPGKGIGQSLA
jgi:hypothetical protein